MRSTPVTPLRVSHRPFECRVQFHTPLRGIEVVALDTDPTPPAPHIVVRVEAPPTTQPTQPQIPVSESPPAPLTHADLWPAEAAEALAADRNRIEAVLKELSTAAANIQQDHANRLPQWQAAAVELASMMASRLLHERFAADDFPIDSKVRDMIVQLGEDPVAVVRLNPLDLDLLRSRLDRLGDDPILTGPGAPRFVTDSALERGECQVEGRESMLLSNVTRELQEIREEMLRSLGNARS